ncbi:major facilitator superfamily domain-containing protein [Sphaerosporella brunnea]|uniref:Major facilitator superfamily domain-containing protein n=1 Tax=Sphaerosporella brunnea TaxID=1250544 RepID=A0A5J5F7E4_9PEZI|nr:major facilitator superfamily domain-containing protein [Sphaerosporella brunnea]
MNSPREKRHSLSTVTEEMKRVRRSTIGSLHSLQFEGESYPPPAAEPPKSPTPVYSVDIRNHESRASSNGSDEEGEEEAIDMTLVNQQPDPSLHLFSRRKKKAIIHLMAIAALFSPLSSNIYFPAIESISKDLHVSSAMVQTTISSYMIFQGLAPSFWGPMSDIKGRRPVLIATFTIYVIANTCLSQVKSFPVLFILRAMQAIGGVSTLSIGSGVIGDMTTKAERGGMMGVFQGVQMMGRSFGPVLGGVLSQFGGFRSIFTFLAAISGAVVLGLLLFLPETLQTIAGKGEVQTRGIYRPLGLKPPSYATQPQNTNRKKEKLSIAVFAAPFKFILEPDVFVSLFFGGIVYTVYSMISSSTTTSLQNLYKLNDLEVGLAFGANGIGCVIGSFTTGKLLDYDYKRTKEEQDAKSRDSKLGYEDDSFPIERARLRSAWIMIMVFGFSTVGYGWSLEYEKHLAVPLVFQFFVGWASTAIFNMNSTLIVDLFPGKSASATAVNNLIRCILGAGGVSVIDLMLEKAGEGTTFTALSSITFAASILVWIELRYGGIWRKKREMKLATKESPFPTA